MRLPLFLFILILSTGFSQRPGRRGGGRERGGRRDRPYVPSSNTIKRMGRSRKRCFNSSEIDLSGINFPSFLTEQTIADAKNTIQTYLDKLPVICADIKFGICDDPPRLHVNISSDGEVVYNEYITEQTEWCRDTDIQNGQCTPCIGMKKDSLVIQPNYAQICPEYKLKCRMFMMELTPSVGEEFNFPCYHFGENCSLYTMKSCLEREGCGWCSKDGKGLEYLSDKTAPGTGCTPRGLGKNVSRPFCSDCAKENFITERQLSNAKKVEQYIETHPGTVVGISISAAFLILCIIVIFIRFYVPRKKGKLLNNSNSNKQTDNGQHTGSIELQDEHVC